MYRLRNLLFSTLAVIVLLTAVGCDSDSDDDDTDADLFVGTWTAVAVSDATGDQTAGFASSVSQFQVSFDEDGTYGLNVAFTDDRQPIQFSGAPYSVTESSNTLSLTIPAAVAGTQVILPFDYDFESNDQVGLTIDNPALVDGVIDGLFTVDYTSPVTITVAR